MSFLKNVKRVPPDPIFGLQQAFIEDKRPEKINLGIGSYKNSELQPILFSSVKKAEKLLWEEETHKEYLPISGFPPFLQAVKELVFHQSVPLEHLAAIQCIGGTGALRLGGEFLFHQGKAQGQIQGQTKEQTRILIPDLTWDNHRRLFEAVGFTVETYPYFDPLQKSFDLKNMVEKLRLMPAGTIVVLQGCCHNPTGVDPTLEQWQKIAEFIKNQELIPFFDFAYQGFGEGIHEDALAIRYFAEKGLPLLVASSFSKNFGLYNERVGALLILAHNREEALNVESSLKVHVRCLYSNPPSHGGKILALVYHNEKLRKEWDQELVLIRERLQQMREKLLQELEIGLQELGQEVGAESRFEHVRRQRGMFSYLGLSEEQVEILKNKHAIYMVKGGRINVSGLNTKNIPHIAASIVKIL